MYNLSKHTCEVDKQKQEQPKQKQCAFSARNGFWCGKVVKCPSCSGKVNPYCYCEGNPEECRYFKPRKWYHRFLLSIRREYLEESKLPPVTFSCH